MLIQYGQALGDYLYDVFVAKFDFWLAFGLIAQLLFTARFLVQWISSERAGQSVVPMAFWFFSMGGGIDDAGLRHRQARTRDHSRPVDGHHHLPPQHHADRKEPRQGVEDAGPLTQPRPGTGAGSAATSVSLDAIGGEFTGGVEHGVGDRADMRVNSPEIAQHVEMQRGGLDGFGPSLAQAIQMPLGGGKLGVAQCSLLGQELARLVDVTRT